MIIKLYVMLSEDIDWRLVSSFNPYEYSFCDLGIMGFLFMSDIYKKYDSYKFIDKYQCFGIYGDKIDLLKVDLESCEVVA